MLTYQKIIQAKEILQTVFFPWRLTRLKFQEKSMKKKAPIQNKNQGHSFNEKLTLLFLRIQQINQAT